MRQSYELHERDPVVLEHGGQEGTEGLVRSLEPGHPQDGAAAAVLARSEHPPLHPGG